MSDPYYPLNNVILKALSDKTYEKRKVAAGEIERIVRNSCQNNDTTPIYKIISLIVNQQQPENINSKKGMLMGLAGASIGLGYDNVGPFVDELTSHIFPCFDDTSGNVRYYAAEALYNVCNLGRWHLLPMFNKVFQVILSLTVDEDNNIRNAAESLDRRMRDIVSQSRSFDILTFIPHLRDKLYLGHDETENVVINWVASLVGLPDVDLLPFLPEIIDGIFFILNSKRQEVKEKAEYVLAEFLALIQIHPTKVKFTEMITIITVHAQSKNTDVKAVAILWILKFIQLSKRKMLPFISSILVAVIPCLALEDDRCTEIRPIAERCSLLLSNLIGPQDDQLGTEDDLDQKSDPMNLECALAVLLEEFKEESNLCRLSALRWIYLLIQRLPKHTQVHIDAIFKGVLESLGGPSDKIVMISLQVLSQIASSDFSADEASPKRKVSGVSESPKVLHKGFHFSQFLESLLEMFRSKRQILKDRGSYIIRELCVMMPVKDVYWKLAELLEPEEDLDFACEMIRTLSLILLTSKELALMRQQLRRTDTEADCEIFVRLYKSWCHSPVATLTLCLLAERYDHAADIIHTFGSMDITTSFLLELDRLIQTLESPIFSFLRMKLLHPESYPALVETLYGILMLIPQSERFHLLRRRLSCIPQTTLTGRNRETSINVEKCDFIDFKMLLRHFEQVKEKHEEFKYKQLQKQLRDTTLDMGKFE